jgi:hypothetical protein
MPFRSRIAPAANVPFTERRRNKLCDSDIGLTQEYRLMQGVCSGIRTQIDRNKYWNGLFYRSEAGAAIARERPLQ